LTTLRLEAAAPEEPDDLPELERRREELYRELSRVGDLRPGPELDKARREAAEYQRFRDLVGQVPEVNEAIRDGRPVMPGDGGEGPSGTEGERGAPEGGADERAAEITRLARGTAVRRPGPPRPASAVRERP
jgi:hypothetical protein